MYNGDDSDGDENDGSDDGGGYGGHGGRVVAALKIAIRD